MGWNKIPPPKPTPPGQWEAYSYGTDYRGWILRCGPAFWADVTQSGGKFYIAINHNALQPAARLDEAQMRAEQAIVQGVRELLPAYKVIVERLRTRAEVSAGNVTPIRPNGGQN